MRFFTSGKENSTSASSNVSPVVVDGTTMLTSSVSAPDRKFGTPLQHHHHTINNNLAKEPRTAMSKQQLSSSKNVVVPGTVKKVVRVRRTPPPSTSVFLSPPPSTNHTNQTVGKIATTTTSITTQLSSLPSSSNTLTTTAFLPPEKTTTENTTPNEKTIILAPGPVGLQLEPINEDPFYGCRVVRFMDGGPKDPGQARKSNKIKPGDLVMKVEAEGKTWIAATTYDEMVNLLKMSNVRRVLTIQSVWTDDMTIPITPSSSEVVPPLPSSNRINTLQGFIPTQKIRPKATNAARKKVVGADHRSSSRMMIDQSETTELPSPILRTPRPHRDKNRMQQVDDDTMDFSSGTGLGADIDWIHSPSDMVLLAHSAQEQSRISASSSSSNFTNQQGNEGPIIVSLNDCRVEDLDAESDHSSLDDDDCEVGKDGEKEVFTTTGTNHCKLSRVAPNRSDSFNSQHTTKSSNRSSSLTDTPRQSLADQFLLVDGYTGPLLPDSQYDLSIISSANNDETTTTETIASPTATSIHQSIDEEAGLSFTSRISQTPAKQLVASTTNKAGIKKDDDNDGTKYDPIMLLQADFDERLHAIQIDYAAKEKELQNLYVQTCERNDTTIHGLQMANQRLQIDLKDHKKSVELADKQFADADARFQKAQRELKSKADAIQEQSIRMIKMDQSRQREITNLELENTRLQEESLSRAMELDMARTMVCEMEVRVLTLEAEKDDLTHRLEEVLVSNEFLQQSINDRETVISSQRKQLLDFENNMQDLTSQFEAYRLSSKEETEKAQSETEAAVKKLSLDFKSSSDEVTRLENDLESNNMVRQEQEKQHRILVDRVTELELFKEEASTFSETLARSIQEKNKIITQSQAATSMIQKENESLHNQVHTMTKDLEALIHEKLAMDEKLAQAWKDVDEARTETSMIHESLLQKLENGEFSANEQIQVKEAIIEELGLEIDGLKEASKGINTRANMRRVLLQLISLCYEKEQSKLETSLALAGEDRHVLTAELKAVQEKRMSDDAQIHYLTQQLHATQMIGERLQSKLDASASEFNERMCEHQLRVESLSSELKSKELSLASHETHLREVEVELRAVQHVINERDETLRSFLVEKEMLQQHLNALSSELAITQAQLIEAKEDYDAVTAENNDTKERLQSTFEENRNLRHQLVAEAATAVCDHRRKDIDICNLTSRLQTVATYLDLAFFTTEQLRYKMESLLLERDYLNDSFRNEIQSLNRDIATLQNEISAQSDNFHTFRDNQDHVVTTLTSRLQTLSDDHALALFKKEQLANNVEVLSLERSLSDASFRTDIQSLHHGIETVQEAFSIKSSRYLTLEDEYLSLKRRNEELESVMKSTESGWVETEILKNREIEMLKSEVRSKDDEVTSNFNRMQELIDTEASVKLSLEATKRELRAALEHHEERERLLQIVIEQMTVDLNDRSATLVSFRSSVKELEKDSVAIQNREISLQKTIDTIHAQNEEAKNSHSNQIDKLTGHLEVKSYQLKRSRNELTRLSTEVDRLTFSQEQLLYRNELLNVEGGLSVQHHHRSIMLLTTEGQSKNIAISSIERKTLDLQSKLDFLQFNEEQLMYKLDSLLPLKAFIELDHPVALKLDSDSSITGSILLVEPEISMPSKIDCSTQTQLMFDVEPFQGQSDQHPSESVPNSSRAENAIISLPFSFEAETVDMKIELSILRKRLSSFRSVNNESLKNTESMRAATPLNPLKLQYRSRGRNSYLYDVAKRENEHSKRTIQVLESVLNSKEDEIIEKSAAIDLFSTTAANLRFELMEKDEEQKHLRIDLDRTRSELDQIKAALGMMSLSELQWNPDATVSELVAMKEVVGNQSDRISELEGILIEAEQCAEDACKSLALAQQSEEVQRESFDSWQQRLRNEMVKLKEASNEKLDEVERQASKASGEMEDRVKSLEFDLGSVTEEMKSLVLLKTTLENNLENAEAVLAEKSVEVDRLLMTANDLSIKIDESSATEIKSDHQNRILLLQKQVLSLLAALIQKHLRKRQLQRTLDVEKAALLKIISDLSSKLIAMEAQHETVESAHLVVENSLKRKILKLRAECVANFLEGKNLEENVASLMDEGRLEESKMMALNKSVVSLQLENAEMVKQMSTLQENSKLETHRLRKTIIQQSVDLRKAREEEKLSKCEVIALSSSMRSLEEETITAKSEIRNELNVALNSLSEKETLIQHLKNNIVAVENKLEYEHSKVAELVTSRGVQADKVDALLATCVELEGKTSILLGEVSAKDAMMTELRRTIEYERQSTNLTLEERLVEMEALNVQLGRVSAELETRDEEIRHLASNRESDLEEIRALQLEKEQLVLTIDTLQGVNQCLENKATKLGEDLINLRRILPVKEIQSQQSQRNISILEDELQIEKLKVKQLLSTQESTTSKLREQCEEAKVLSLRVVDLEQKNEFLSQTISTLPLEHRRELEQLREERDVARVFQEESLSSLESKCEDQTRAILVLKEELSMEQVKICSLEIEVNAGQNKISELVDALESGVEEMSKLRASMSELATRNKLLNEIQAKLRETIAVMETDLVDESSKVKDLVSLGQTQADDLFDVRAKLRSLETEANERIHALAMDVGTLRIENELIGSDLASSTSEVKALNETIASKRDRIELLTKENCSLLLIIEEMKANISRSVLGMEQRNTILEKEVETLQRELVEASTEQLEKSKTLIHFERTHASVCDDLAEMTSRNLKFQAQMENYECIVEECAHLKQQAAEKERYIMELKDEINNLRKNVVAEETRLGLLQHPHQDERLIENQSNIDQLQYTACDLSLLNTTWFPRCEEHESFDDNSPLKGHLASVKSAFHTQKAILEDLKLSESVLAKFMKEVMVLMNQTEKDVLGISGRLATVEELHLFPTKTLASLDLAGLESSKMYIDDVRTRLESMASLAYTTSAELKIRQREFVEWQANRIHEPAIPITPFKTTNRSLRVPPSEQPYNDRSAAGARILCSILEKKSNMQLASAFRKWSCSVGAMKASASHKDTAIALAQQLEITREKLITLKSSLQGKKKNNNNNGKPRLRRILDRLDSNSSLVTNRRVEDMNSLTVGPNDSFGL